MFRSLLSAAAIFVLFFSGLFLPVNVSARSRCPVKMPETLLSLYQNSDGIYIATFDKKADGEVTEDTADYSALNIKKHFSISSTLKGESRKFFVLDDTEYRYKNTPETAGEPEDGEEAEEPDDPEASIELKPGDTLLLFLKNGEDNDPPTLTDYRDGTKKLSMEQIGVYEARIKELSSIFSEKKVNEARIVEWLIRCAEDPVTRWEGTFELLQSVQNVEWQEQAAEELKERKARGEPVEEEPTESEAANEDGEEEENPRKNVDTSNFAKLLDVNQKQALANLLLDRPAPAADDSDRKVSKIRGDGELIELVKRWGDPRLAGFLLDQLRINKDDPSTVARTMNTISEILEDKEIGSLAEKYAEISYEDDADVVVVESESEVAYETAVEGPKNESENTPVRNEAEKVLETQTPNAEPEKEAVKPKKITYKELRDEIFLKFIETVEKVMAEKEKASKAER